MEGREKKEGEKKGRGAVLREDEQEQNNHKEENKERKNEIE